MVCQYSNCLGPTTFAITGASKTISPKADIFGIIVLATVLALQKIMRDVIFGRFAAAFSDPIDISLTVQMELLCAITRIARDRLEY